MSTEFQNESNQEMNRDNSFDDFIRIALQCGRYILKKWIIVVVFGLFGGAVGLSYSIFKKLKYQASTTFVLEEGGSSPNLGNLGGLASMAGIDIGGGSGLFKGDNIIELYKSRSMIQKTLLTKAKFNNQEQLIIDRFIESNELKSKWKETDWSKINFLGESENNVLRDSVLREIVKTINKESLRVSKPDKKLSILKVEVTSIDEQFAKIFSDELVLSVNEFYVQTKTKKSSDNVNILQDKVDSVQRIMRGAIYSVSRTSDSTPNMNPIKQTQRVAPMQQAQFTAEMNKAVLGELVKNLELSKITLLKETPLIQIVDQPIFPLENDKVGKIKAIAIGGFIFCLISILVLVLMYNLKKKYSE